MSLEDEERKLRNARWQASVWNRRVDEIESRIKAQGITWEPFEYPDVRAALDEARRNAGYWNQIVNAENGYV